jgi:methionine sulfoxide reductase heme-binding subunit
VSDVRSRKPSLSPGGLRLKAHALLKPIVFVLALAPALWLLYAAISGGLSPNPIEDVTHATGRWALRLLLVTLAITPLRRLTGINELIRVRRMLGLFAFFYASLHLLTYVALDQFFALDAIWDDIAKRPYVTVGFLGYVLMVPLAITSTAGWIRRLGGRRWQQLHRLAYVSAIAGVLHFLWLVKADTSRPLRYAAVLAALLGLRLGFALGRRRRASAQA